MGIINRERALYMATGIDNTGLYSGRREAMGIIKAMASQITSFDVFSGIGLSAATALASAAKDSYNFEKEFRKNMLEVATISTQIGGSMTDFMNRVVSITQQIPVTAPEAAKALYQIVSAGHDGADGMKVLEVSARSAVGGLTDTATAADAITTLLNAYKLSADKAEQISDQLFTTVRLGKTDFGQLGRSIAQVAPIAAAYGVEIDQVLAAVATLTKQGTPTAQAMTQVRASIIAASRELGDGAFKGRTFQEALELIAKKANGSETALRGMITEVEAQVGILALTGRNAKSAASDLNELQNSAGATEAAFRKMKDEVGNQLTLLTNNINAALRPMGTAILEEVSDVAQKFNEAFADGSAQEALKDLGDLIVIVTGAFIGYKGAVGASTVAQNLHTKAMLISRLAAMKHIPTTQLLTNALKAQTIAILKNTAAMMTNPYALAAAAVAGLGFVLYKCATEETELDKANKRLRASTTEIEKGVASEIGKLSLLEKKLTETKKGTEGYNRIKKSIVDNYGKYYNGLDGEIERVGNLSTAYSKLTENIRLSIGQRKFESFFKTEQENLDKIIERNLDKAYEKLIKEYGKEKGLKLYQSFFNAAIRGDALSGEEETLIKHAGLWSFSGNANHYLVEIREAKKASEKVIKEFKEKYQITEDDMVKVLSGNSNSDETITENRTLKQLVSYIETAQKELKSLQDQANKGLISPDKIKEQSASLAKLKAEYTLRTGKDYDRGSDLLKSQTELSRTILDSDLKLQEMRLSIMEDGRQKRLKQSELEYKQQKATIDKEYQDTVQKYRDQHKPVPNSVRTVYEARLGANNAAKVARDNKIDEDYTKERKEHEAALTAYMLSEESKRKKAIRERYDVEREWAKKQFDGENMTDAEYTNYLGRINTAEAAENLQELLDKYQDYTAQRAEIERNFDEEIATLERSRTDRNAAEVDRAIAEAQKKRKEALSGIDLSEFQDSIDWSSVFGDLDAQTTQALSSLRDKLKNYINKAAKDLKPEDLKVLQDAFKDIDLKISERRPFRELGKDLEEYKAAQAEVNKAQEDLNYVMAGGEIVTGLYMDKTGKMVKKLLTQEEAERNLTEAQKKRKEAMAAIGNSAAGIAGQIGNVSNAASKIVNVLEEDFGVKVGDNIKGLVEGFNELSDGISSVVQSAMKGDIAGVIAGVVQSVGGLFKSVTSIFGLGNHKGEEDLKRLEEASNRIVESQKIINSLIEKRIELINKATIAEQKNLAATTEQAIKNQKAYYEQQFKGLQDNWLLAKKGKHNNLTVADLGIGSIEELADFLTGSDRLLALQKQGYSVRDLDKWMEIVNAYQGLEESKKELAETTAKNLTGITLDDAQSALDEFLKNADTSMEDVAGSFEDYMRNAMLGLVKQNILNKSLEKWYENFEDAVKNDGRLSETEVKDLQQEYENAFTTAQEAYNNMLKVANISPESDSSGRQASEKGIASMSQDSANELNGNFSALLIYSNKTAENTSSLRESMNYILEIQRAGWGDVRAIKELTSQMRVHTEKISELSEMIESNTKKSATEFETLNRQGLKIKR